MRYRFFYVFALLLLLVAPLAAQAGATFSSTYAISAGTADTGYMVFNGQSIQFSFISEGK